MTKILLADETGTLQDVGSIQNFVFDTMLPSNQYIDTLTLTASGQSFIAQDNGWFFVKAKTLSSGVPYINLFNVTSGSKITNSTASPASTGGDISASIPVLKGTEIQITYGNVNNIQGIFTHSAKAISEQMDMDIDYVVESSPRGANPWYRKWKSGYIEQGASFVSGASSTLSVTFALPMANVNYGIQISTISGFRLFTSALGSDFTRTVSGFTGIQVNVSAGTPASEAGNRYQWEVKGQAA